MTLIRVARSRWNFATGLTFAALLSLPAGSLSAADKDKSPATKKEDESKAARADVMRDVTELVEVTVNGGLLSTSKTKHSAAVSIKNTSAEDLTGPLVVVVDETGIATLAVKDPDGMLEGDKPYVDVLDKRGTLKAGRSLRTQKIEFETDEALTLDLRNQFSLKLRVLYLPESARTSKTARNSKGEDLIEGKKYSEQEFARVSTIQEKWTLPLLQRGNGLVYGTAVAEDKQGNLVVEVYSQRDSVADQLPNNVDGVPVKNFVVGEIFHAGPAQPGGLIYRDGVPTKPNAQNSDEQEGPVPDNGPAKSVPGQKASSLTVISNPTQTFPRPVPIGVSISNGDRWLLPPRLQDKQCYSGTLGCRCIDRMGTPYILTNLHVGGAYPSNPLLILTIQNPDFLIGIPGERILQTSTGDNIPQCVFDGRNIVGILYDYEQITFSDTLNDWVDGTLDPLTLSQVMDASISRAVPNTVGYATPPDAYGAPKQELAVVRLGMPVQKFGRTTVYTKGQIIGLNAYVIIDYGYGTSFAGFTKQIMVANMSAFGAPFSSAGDSGSLIVEHRPGHPDDRKPVALLFAGGPSGAVDLTIANPLGPILARFGLTIDDGSGNPSNSTSGTMGGVLGPLDPPSDYPGP